MRVIVCGSRDGTHWTGFFSTMDALHKELCIELVIQGDAPGIDGQAIVWATERGVPCAGFAAHWRTLGHAAGPIRNGWMLKHGQPDLVIAFPGGRGTSNMVKQARNAGVPVREVAPPASPE